MSRCAFRTFGFGASGFAGRCSTVLFLLLAGLCCSSVRAGDAQAKLPTVMQKFVDAGQISGAVTVVGRRDGIACCQAVGLRDIAAGDPMRPDTLFRIASMTKPITSLGLMLLLEEGKLAVDDPVEKHLPEFRGQWLVSERTGASLKLKRPARKITLRDLLTHTSGLPGRPPEGLADLYLARQRTLCEAILVQSQQPLEFEPGSKWAYCNLGIDTLGRVIEVVAGEPYERFLQRRIFQPLDMRDTTFFPTAAQLRRTATLYEIRNGKLAPSEKCILGPTPAARYPIPAGGLFSTGPDLAKLYQTLLCGGRCGHQQQLVAAETIALMTRVHTGELKTGFVPGMGFGLGVGVVRAPEGVTAMLSPGTFGHGGAFGTQGWIDPQQDLFVVMLIQRTGLPNGDASEMRGAFQTAAVAAVKERDARAGK